MGLRGSLQMFTIICLMRGTDAPHLGPQVVMVEGCEGQDKLMLTEDYTRLGGILYYEWYYNITNTICINKLNGSEVDGPYKSKVEQCNTTGIHLKNLSLNDSGEYTLKALIENMPEEFITKIYLNVLVSPTKQCRPHISYHSDNWINCSTSCGYIRGEWRPDKTGLSVLNGSLLQVSCPWKGEPVSCCLQVQNMKCLEEDKSELCLSVNISSCNEEGPTENGPELNTTKDPNSSNTIDWWTYLIIGAVIIIIIMVIILFFWWIKRKKRQTNNSLSEEMKEAEAPLKDMCEKNVSLSEVKEESEENVPLFELKMDEVSTPVESSEEKVPLSDVIEEADSPATELSDKEQASTELEPGTNSEAVKELQELRLAARCKICFANKIGVVFMPYKHIATCENCSVSLQHCPVCRTIIEMKINIHFG
ncbi:hypothetical protein CHS0354_001749 [Potamilus streckersoni]|uniref:RING-type domain-containing protein n=1 Tax=Potamilus streckersoni TaxID=2493646 RepID=A0AAE0T2S2_9BIVA|nr:hypothetical protein CHS0354_001749 [Potamilus streckersoni]